MQREHHFSDTAVPWPIADLLSADAFSHAVDALQLRETHISWVILTGPFAYKIKKPVKLDFIDASSLTQRRRFCEEELRLNRRLAPELYVDVVSIVLREGRAVVGADGSVVEYAVRMRQFRASDELPALLASNDVTAAQLAALGELLAQFHLGVAVAAPTDAPQKTSQMLDVVVGNLNQLQDILSAGQRPSLEPIATWMRGTARTLESAFQARERNGFVREGHGDLHASNIVRHAGRLVPFDCIEFDPRLRWIDVMDDVGFLVMDLASRARADLAAALLNRYLEITGDYDGLRLLPFYATHRALVRAKVAGLTAAAAPARAGEFRRRIARRLSGAASWTTQRRPMLILMHGASGSGKSWLSSRLVPEIPALRVRSDLERKRLARLSPTESAAAAVREGIYSREFSDRTYDRLAACAEMCLSAGLSVIIDASFLQATKRERFRALANRSGAACVIVSCEADPMTLSRQVTERAARGGDPSDATLAVLETQLREIEPFTPDEQASVIVVDTRTPNAVQRVSREIHARLSPERELVR